MYIAIVLRWEWRLRELLILKKSYWSSDKEIIDEPILDWISSLSSPRPNDIIYWKSRIELLGMSGYVI